MDVTGQNVQIPQMKQHLLSVKNLGAAMQATVTMYKKKILHSIVSGEQQSKFFFFYNSNCIYAVYRFIYFCYLQITLISKILNS